MRDLKNKKGLTAYLVLVIGSMTLGSSALLAKSPTVGADTIEEVRPKNVDVTAPVKASDDSALKAPANPNPQPGKPVPPQASLDGATSPGMVPSTNGPAPSTNGMPAFQPPFPGSGAMPGQGMPPPFGGRPPMENAAGPGAPDDAKAPGGARPPFGGPGAQPLSPPPGMGGLQPPSTNGMPPAFGRNGQPDIGGQVNRRVHGDGPSALQAQRGEMPPPPNAQRPRGGAPVPKDDDVFRVVPQKCATAKGQFIWNFEEEELINILRQVSDLLCKTIVVNDAVGKNMKMTIIGKSPLTPKDAWDVLMASMAAKGLTLIEQGKTWTVVKKADSKNYATPMYAQGRQARNNEEIGTLFYKTQHASQDVLKNVARALISKDGLVETVGDQFVIVIDSNSNIRRLGSIFAQVDIEDAINKIHIISLHNADAKTVEKQLRDLFDIAPGGRPRMRRGAPGETRSSLEIEKIIADERTNALIVVSDKDTVDKLKEVVALMDMPATDQSSKGKIHVKKLRFADAKKIAETLTAVVQQGRSGSRYGRRRDEGTNELFEGEVKITAHESSNTLVTVASANDYRSLLATINKLDERKEQVYVEAVILDIQVKDENEFGINIFSGMGAIPGLGGSSIGVVANPGGSGIARDLKSTLTSGAMGANVADLGPNSIGALAVLGNFLSGGVAGIVGDTISPNSKIPTFGAVLQALSTNSNVDVLSTPYLLTTDNSPAEMSVGDKVPVLRGASSIGGGGIGGLGVPMQNIVHEDVKLTFKITPHVGADDNVRLDIEQEVNELGPKMMILNQEQHSFRTKTAKTQLVLRDQQTGVIGGLIHHSSRKTDNKIPFLGDIPILGWLFKTRKSDNERRSLLLIITPYIIRNDDDYRKILERKLKEREEFARLYYGDKIKTYNPHIEYDKKAGPLSSMLLSIESEMNRVENGGPGDSTDTVIVPKENESSSESESTIPDGDGGEQAYLGEDPSYSEEFAPEEDFAFEEFASPPSDDFPSEGDIGVDQ